MLRKRLSIIFHTSLRSFVFFTRCAISAENLSKLEIAKIVLSAEILNKCQFLFRYKDIVLMYRNDLIFDISLRYIENEVEQRPSSQNEYPICRPSVYPVSLRAISRHLTFTSDEIQWRSWWIYFT